MAFRWQAAAGAMNFSSMLSTWLDAQTSPRIIIPNGYLDPGHQYNISLSVENFLGGNASKIISFRMSSQDIPSLSLSGSSVFLRSEDIEIYALGAVACSENSSASSGLTYEWELKSDASVRSKSSDPRWFKLFAYSLSSLKYYTVKATVTDNLGQQNYASFTFYVDQDDLYAKIMGGDRTVGSNIALALDGSTSLDLNVAGGSPENATFDWYLPQDYTGSTNYSVDSSRITVSKAVLVEGSQSFGLSLTKGQRQSNASVVITVVGEALPACSIGTSFTTKFNANSKLTVQGSVQATIDEKATGTWSEDYNTGFESSSELSSVSSTAISKNVLGLTSSTFYLVIPAGNLIAGADYSFRLSASFTGSSTEAASQLAVVVNSPPTSGVLYAQPLSGSVLVDSFSLITTYWADDSEDFPLQYEFFYYLQNGSSTICDDSRGTIVRILRSSNKVGGLILPSNPDGNITVGVTAYDDPGASAAACSTVQVAELEASASEVADLAEALLTEALDNFDSDALFTSAGTAVSAMSNAGGSADELQAFQSLLFDVIFSSTANLDASSGVTSQLSSVVDSALKMNSTIQEDTLLTAQNVTALLLNMAGGLGAPLGGGTRAAAVGALSSMLGAGVANTSGAALFSSSSSYMAQLLTVGLVADEDPVTQTSDSLQMLGAVLSVSGNGSLAALVSPKVAVAGEKASQIKVGSGLEGSATAQATLIEFSSHPRTDQIEQLNGTANGSTLTSSVLRLGLATTDSTEISSLNVTVVLQQTTAQAVSGSREEWEVNVTCQAGIQETVSVPCGHNISEEVVHECTGTGETVEYTCRAPWTGPQCLLYDQVNDLWTAQYCTLLNFSATSVECSCYIENDVGDSQNRRHLAKGTGKAGDSDGAFELDFASNIVSLGSEIGTNFAITAELFSDPSLISQNAVVFIVMACVLVAFPLLGFGSILFNWVVNKEREALKNLRRARMGRRARRGSLGVAMGRRLSQQLTQLKEGLSHVAHVQTSIRHLDEDNAVPTIVGQRASYLQRMVDELKHCNDYIQLFAHMTLNDKAVLVAKLWTYTLSLMFWDANFYALLFPPGVNDCWLISTYSECVNSELNCAWDGIIVSCGPYAVEDNADEVLYVAALSMLVTVPVMVFWEWFIDTFLPHHHEHHLALPGQMEEDGEEGTTPRGALGLDNHRSFAQLLGGQRGGGGDDGTGGGFQGAEEGVSIPASVSGRSSDTGSAAEQRQSESALLSKLNQAEYTLGSKGSILTSKSRRELYDEQKAWLHEADIAERVEKYKSLLMSYRRSGAERFDRGPLMNRLIRREVIKAFNLEKRMELMTRGEKNAFLLEAAWHDYLPDGEFQILEKYVLDESTRGRCFDLHIRWNKCRQIFGWVTLIIYNFIMAFYVCLFGIQYGESYTTGWMKSFAFGFGQDLLILSPFTIILLHVFLHLGVEKKVNVNRIQKLRFFAASRQVAGNYPDLIAR